MKQNLKRTGALLLAAVMLCTLAGRGGGEHDREHPSNTDGLREVNVVLDWYPNAPHTFLYVAMERGYFAEEGLKVNLQFPTNTNDAMSSSPVARKSACTISMISFRRARIKT